MNIQITLLYAAILSIIYVALTIRVIKHRVTSKVLLGDGGISKLNIAVRTHGDFGEYIPLALFLMMGVELYQYSTSTLHTLGIALVAA